MSQINANLGWQCRCNEIQGLGLNPIKGCINCFKKTGSPLLLREDFLEGFRLACQVNILDYNKQLAVIKYYKKTPNQWSSYFFKLKHALLLRFN